MSHAETPGLLESKLTVVCGVPFELKWQEVEMERGYKSITFTTSVPNHTALYLSPNTISLEAFIANLEAIDETKEPIVTKSDDIVVDEISEAILVEPLISDFKFAPDSQPNGNECFSQPSTSDTESEPKPTNKENKEIATGRAVLEKNEAGQLIQKFPCQSCPKVFVTNSQLSRHVAIHDGNFICSCGIRYRSKSALTKHSIEVHGLRSPRFNPLKGKSSSSATAVVPRQKIE